ncbi:MAG TPA: hypothetical protein VJG64_02875 [Candidatus Paceibacterota bacterium]
MKRRVLIGAFVVAFPLLVLADVATSTEATSTPESEAVESIMDTSDASSTPMIEPEDIATTTDESSDTTSETAGEPTLLIEDTTLEEDTSIPEADSSETALPPVQELAPIALASSTSPVADPDAFSARIKTLEDTYYLQHGTYLQILYGNLLPTYESGTVAEKLGETIPDNMRVDIYEAPSGPGYQIIFQLAGIEYSIGKGPESPRRSYMITLPIVAEPADPIVEEQVAPTVEEFADPIVEIDTATSRTATISVSDASTTEQSASLEQ